MTPAYASITSFSLESDFFEINRPISFTGTQNGNEEVYVTIHSSTGKYKGILTDSEPSNGKFSVTPKSASNFFKTEGSYTATAFVNSDRDNGLVLKLTYKDGKIFTPVDYVLKISPITDNKVITVGEKLTFTASITDSSLKNVVFSLKNAPANAKINSASGEFEIIPTSLSGSMQSTTFNFDIVATKGALTDTESVTLTIKQRLATPVNEPPATPAKQPQSIIPQVMAQEPELASFVKSGVDPQTYVDRYNNEPTYKKWFDDNYSQYDSIYDAVGLEDPTKSKGETELASFVKSGVDPQTYVDRYNNEATYKKWFDDNYSQYDSIYDAVGLVKPALVNPQDTADDFGECGKGTKLVDGTCVVIPKRGGGCLIATAAYGSEMAPQVQFLREIRDNQLMTTNSGFAFMSGFNQFYYSFSPYVADAQRENPLFKEAVKIGITPLLLSLSILSNAESESQVLGYGIGVILLNIGMYFAVPAIVIFKTGKYMKLRSSCKSELIK